MMVKTTLPIEAHDHFRKANELHKYVTRDLAEATKHALETGIELLAAKESVPHGSWECECGRLFDGSVRTAQFYMQFARHMAAIPKAQSSRILLLEQTLEGAAKVAKRLASGKNEKTVEQADSGQHTKQSNPNTEGDKALSPESDYEPDLFVADGEPDTTPTEQCPNCAGRKWVEDDEGWSCAKCSHPYGEPAGDVDDDRLGTQRQKTVKTAEALMRCFDDLQVLKANALHSSVIPSCKGLIVAARGWK